jgi:hypothetical protein
MNYEQRILKREGHVSYESKIINEREDLIEDIDLCENKSKHDVFLLFLSKQFSNKKLLSFMEKGNSSLAQIMSYKDVFMSKIHNISISGHQLNLMSYLYTVSILSAKLKISTSACSCLPTTALSFSEIFSTTQPCRRLVLTLRDLASE